MKTNKTQATTTAAYIFNFAPCDKAMLSHYNAGATLTNAVITVWDAAPQEFRVVRAFRDQFTVWATKAGYGETHIRRTLGSFEFLQLRAKTGKANATKQAKAKANKPVASIASILKEVKAAKLSKADIVKLIAELASL